MLKKNYVVTFAGLMWNYFVTLKILAGPIPHGQSAITSLQDAMGEGGREL